MTTTTEIELSREQRKLCRQYAGLRKYDHCPVVIVEGDQPPMVCGTYYHWETMGGRPIYYPSAYSRKGWSNMRYISSSRRVKVGREWVIKHLSNGD